MNWEIVYSGGLCDDGSLTAIFKDKDTSKKYKLMFLNPKDKERRHAQVEWQVVMLSMFVEKTRCISDLLEPKRL